MMSLNIHEIFRRDTTPEYCEGDHCRPLSPVPVPVVHRTENLMVESSLIKDEPRLARSSDNDNDDKQGQSHVVARSFQQSSVERQYNTPGGQSNLIESSSSQQICLVVFKSVY